MRKELEWAATVQSRFLPGEIPAPAPFDLAVVYRPAMAVGGDFYEFISLAGGNLAVIVADGAGHGVQAALGTALVKFAASGMETRDLGPGEILTRMNRVLYKGLPREIPVVAAGGYGTGRGLLSALALGAEASFVARTIDMDRNHTIEMLSAMHNNVGAGILEIYQNCNVFNDKAFLDLTDKSTRDQNRIWLKDGEPVIFGEDDEYGVQVDANGARIVEVADVGRHNIHVHNATSPNPSAAFALSRISQGPYGPTTSVWACWTIPVRARRGGA